MNKRAFHACSIVLLAFLFAIIGSCESTVGPEESIADLYQTEASLLNVTSGVPVTLYAAQNIDAGEVVVNNEGGVLKVTFDTKQNWCLLETHLHIWKDESEMPVNKKGNPVPGLFEYSETHDCVDSYTYETDKDPGMDFFIAAHAVVQTGIAPYYASSILEVNQGLKKDNTAVEAVRSDPNNALEYETGHDPSNFFSLGFGGDITLGFDCPIKNGPEDDIRVIEDTWSSYPLESANIFVSQDGSSWTLLGEADNTHRDVTYNIHTESYFDLANIGFEWAKYVKIVDTSDPAVHNNNADGYDLNAVEALHNCEDIIEETAWGDGALFVPKGNWGTYFEYTGSGH